MTEGQSYKTDFREENNNVRLKANCINYAMHS